MFLATAAVAACFLISAMESVSAQPTQIRREVIDSVGELIERTRSLSASQLSDEIIAKLKWNCQSLGMPTPIKGEMVKLCLTLSIFRSQLANIHLYHKINIHGTPYH
jgi:hypothetical protein